MLIWMPPKALAQAGESLIAKDEPGKGDGVQLVGERAERRSGPQLEQLFSSAAALVDAPVDEAVLTDLRARLTAFRPVQLPPGRGWDRGMDPDFLTTLVAYWGKSYRWREHESRIRSLPWVLSGEEGPTPVRSVHQRAANSAAMPVLLLRGWPDSVLRFERVLPLLSDVHVVVPALPGYPFAAPVEEVGLSTSAMAHAVAEVWAQIGPDGDALHRCSRAHWMADTQDDPREELRWDLEALRAADSLTDERAAAAGVTSPVAAFYPSLHLNLGAAYRKLGHLSAGRHHLALGQQAVSALPDNGYAQMITAGLDALAQRLDTPTS